MRAANRQLRPNRLAQLAAKLDDPNSVPARYRSPLGEAGAPFGGIDYAPEVHALVDAAYEDGWVLSGFDWGTWAQTPEATQLVTNPEAVAQATVDQLTRLLTVLIRQERFAEGTLKDAFDTGLMRRVLHRIMSLTQVSAAPSHTNTGATGLALLRDAIDAYGFPSVTYDFGRGVERVHSDMRDLEASICSELLSNDLGTVRHGLANILYWGLARIGSRDVRVRAFLDQVTEAQLSDAQSTFAILDGPALKTLGALRLPQFSQISFLSKLRMFLDPASYVTLDLKLAKLRLETPRTVLHDLTVRTSIPASRHNEMIYASWCAACARLAKRIESDRPILAADVERGIFHLVDTAQAAAAAGILADVG